jgi:hypothetical protein
MSSLSSGSGKVLGNPKIALVFWGTGWGNSPAISVEELAGVFSSILSTPYMSKLTQYNGIRNAKINNITVDTSKVFTETINNTSAFHQKDLTDMLALRFDRGDISLSPDTLYMVISELSVVCIETAPEAAAGFHNSFQHGESFVHYAWVSNSGSLTSGNTIAKTFVHKLVEACTDPELNSFKRPNDGAEIGDICNNRDINLSRITSKNAPNGIVIQPYFSDRDNMCVLPTEYSVKWWADTTNTDVTKGLKRLLPQGAGSIKALLSSDAVPPDPGFGISVSQARDQLGGQLKVEGKRFSAGGEAAIVVNYIPKRTLNFQSTIAINPDGTFLFQESFRCTSTDVQDSSRTISVIAIDMNTGNLTTAETGSEIWVCL